MTENNAPQADGGGLRVAIIIGGFVLMGLLMAASILFISPNTSGAAIERTARPPEGDTNAVGAPVPDVPLPTLDGETVVLSDYRGKVVFLNFWATWCGPCQREMPVFEAFMAEQRDDAVILAVNHGETADEIRPFLREYGIENLPIFLDEDYIFADGLGVMNLPVTYVIDANGVVRTFKLGEVSRDDLDEYIAAVGEG